MKGVVPEASKNAEVNQALLADLNTEGSVTRTFARGSGLSNSMHATTRRPCRPSRQSHADSAGTPSNAGTSESAGQVGALAAETAASCWYE